MKKCGQTKSPFYYLYVCPKTVGGVANRIDRNPTWVFTVSPGLSVRMPLDNYGIYSIRN